MTGSGGKGRQPFNAVGVFLGMQVNTIPHIVESYTGIYGMCAAR